MNPVSRAAALVAAATLALSVAPLSSAEAAGKEFRTVVKVNSAKFQACKVAVDDGANFRIYGRLNNTASKPKDKVKGGIYVLRKGERTNIHFETPFVAGGRISGVEHLVVKNNPKLTLEVYASATQAGSGGVIDIADVHKC
jgi:hypothetical protein